MYFGQYYQYYLFPQVGSRGDIIVSVKLTKDGRWLCQIDRSGIKRTRRIFPTMEAAKKFEQDYLSSAGVVINEHHQRDKRRLLDLIDLWEKYVGVSLSDCQHRCRAMKHAAEALGNPIAIDLTAEQFVQYRFERLRTVSGKTVNNLHGYYNAMFNKLRRLGVIDYPCVTCNVDMIKLQERELTYLSYDQIDLLLNDISARCVNQSTWYVTQLCLRTGARWGEAERMRVKQVRDGRVTFIKTKSKKTRSIPLDRGFEKLLKEWSKGKFPDDRIFTNCIGAYRRAVDRVGIQLPRGQMTHVLRHSFASHYVMRGGNILTLQKILGHSDIKQTMRYAHLAPGYLNSALELNPMCR